MALLGSIGGALGGILGGLFAGKTPSYNINQANQDLGNFNSASAGLYNYTPTPVSYTNVDPVKAAQSATNFDAANIGTYNNEASSINAADLTSRLASEAIINPQWQSQRDQASANDSALLQGQIPLDVQQQMARSNAYKTYQEGYSGNPSGRSGTLARDLGLTSLGLQQQGSNDAQNWLKTDNAIALPTQVTGMDILNQQGLSSQQVINTDISNSQGQFNAANSNANRDLQSNDFNATGLQNIYSTDLNTNLKLLSQQESDAMNQHNATMQMWQGIGSAVGGAAGAFAGGGAGMGLGLFGGGGNSGSSGTNYSNQFGSDQMSSAGYFESPGAAQSAGISNPQFWGSGANTGFYGTYS